MSTHDTRIAIRISLGWALCAIGACVGTPTPEPPDFLPSPAGGLIFPDNGASPVDPMGPTLGSPIDAGVGNPTVVLPCNISGSAGSVLPDSQVWVVDLDDGSSAPQSVPALADGSFEATISARAGDRVRLVTRLGDRHSQPLDGLCESDDGTEYELRELPSRALDCLTVSSGELSGAPGQRQRLLLDNQCTDDLTITRASLRFDRRGFTLAAPPKDVPAGGSASLEISFTARDTDDDDANADVLLLDVSTKTMSGHYAIGLWATPGGTTARD